MNETDEETAMHTAAGAAYVDQRIAAIDDLIREKLATPRDEDRRPVAVACAGVPRRAAH